MATSTFWLRPIVVITTSTRRPWVCDSGMNHATPLVTWQVANLSKPLGVGTPHRRTISGSPQAAAYAPLSSTGRRGWSATESGSALTSDRQARASAPDTGGAFTETVSEQPAAISRAAVQATAPRLRGGGRRRTGSGALVS